MTLLSPGYLTVTLLYAEIHFKYPALFSRLKNNFPEVAIDCPSRLEAGRPSIPLLLIWRDADRYPCDITSLSAAIAGPGYSKEYSLLDRPLRLDGAQGEEIFEIPAPPAGKVYTVKARFSLRRGSREYGFVNDNYPFGKNSPPGDSLRLYVADEPLPRTPGWHYGDIHVHSSYTSDQVEFGASPEATARMGQALGLAWAAITDHSYDLDDRTDDFMRNDPFLSKWRDFLRRVDSFNSSRAGFVLVPGEEISCGNDREKNVHLLALGCPDFIPGMGDSAEQPLHRRPTLRIPEVIERIVSGGGVAIAAHPTESIPGVHRFVFLRGQWGDRDCRAVGLSGLQLWNGVEEPYGLTDPDGKGMSMWVKSLLDGSRLFLYAGNDAHGDFNLTRKIRIPFLCGSITRTQLFGNHKTCLYLPRDPTPAAVLCALRRGRCVVTNGPFLEITLTSAAGDRIYPGEFAPPSTIPPSKDTSPPGEWRLNITAISTREFGFLERIVLREGATGSRREKIIEDIVIGPGEALEERRCIPIQGRKGSRYIRGEAVSLLPSGERRYCLTNPIWFGEPG